MRTSVTVPFHVCRENVTSRFEYNPGFKSGVCYSCSKVVDLTTPEGIEQITNVIWSLSSMKRLVDESPVG